VAVVLAIGVLLVGKRIGFETVVIRKLGGMHLYSLSKLNLIFAFSLESEIWVWRLSRDSLQDICG
jgi:hypothetical protein